MFWCLPGPCQPYHYIYLFCPGSSIGYNCHNIRKFKNKFIFMWWGNIILQREHEMEEQTFFWETRVTGDRRCSVFFTAAFLNLTSVDINLPTQTKLHYLRLIKQKIQGTWNKKAMMFMLCWVKWRLGCLWETVGPEVGRLSSLWYPWQCHAIPWRAYGAGSSCQNKIRCFHPRVCFLMVVYYHPLLNLFVFCPTRKILKVGKQTLVLPMQIGLSPQSHG